MATLEIKGDRKSYRLALLLLLLVTIAGLWAYDHYSLTRELSQQIENSAGKDKIIERWKDTADREHVLATVRQVTLRELKNSQDSAIKALREEIGNVKNLVSRINIKTTTAGTVAVAVHDTIIKQADTTKPKLAAKTFNYRDKWLRLQGIILGDSAHVMYGVTNESTTDTKWQREKWYKRKSLLLEVRSSNPNTTVNSVQTLVVSVPKLKWYETRIAVGAASFGLGYLVGRVK